MNEVYAIRFESVGPLLGFRVRALLYRYIGSWESLRFHSLGRDADSALTRMSQIIGGSPFITEAERRAMLTALSEEKQALQSMAEVGQVA